jgi:hypothetical protein
MIQANLQFNSCFLWGPVYCITRMKLQHLETTVQESPGNLPPLSHRPQLATPDRSPAFPRSPGETPRAYSAFMAWFQLGQSRSLQGIADGLGEGLDTVKQWSSKHRWSERLLSFNTGLLERQAGELADHQLKLAADWAARLDHFREQQWEAAQKLLSAAQCFLESFGDQDLGKMTLSQVSRALCVSSEIGRFALAGLELPLSTNPVISPIQQQLMDAVKLVYGHEVAGHPTESTGGMQPATASSIPRNRTRPESRPSATASPISQTSVQALPSINPLNVQSSETHEKR